MKKTMKKAAAAALSRFGNSKRHTLRCGRSEVYRFPGTQDNHRLRPPEDHMELRFRCKALLGVPLDRRQNLLLPERGQKYELYR